MFQNHNINDFFKIYNNGELNENNENHINFIKVDLLYFRSISKQMIRITMDKYYMFKYFTIKKKIKYTN